MADLVLPLKGEYFDAIKDGSKLEEYRLDTDYWHKRLVDKASGMPKKFDRIILLRGYPKRGDSARRLVRAWKGWKHQRITHPHFGPDPVVVYAIDVSTPA